MGAGFTVAIERVAAIRPKPGGVADDEGCSGVAQGGLRGTKGSWWGPTQPISKQGAILVEEAEVKDSTRASFLFLRAIVLIAALVAIGGGAEEGYAAQPDQPSAQAGQNAAAHTISHQFLQRMLLLRTGISDSELEARRIDLPYGRTLDFSALVDLLSSSPDQLVQAIEAQGLKVFRIPNAHPRNPVFQTARPVTEAMLATGEFEDTRYRYEGSPQSSAIKVERRDGGFFVSEESPDLGQWGPFVAVLESASTYTLIHEYVHFLFSQQQSPETRAYRAGLYKLSFYSYRSLDFNSRVILSAPERTSKAHRDSVIENLIDYARYYTEFASFIATEEVAIETLLAMLIREGSPYFNLARRVEGLEYAYRNWYSSILEFERLVSLSEDLLYAFAQKAGRVTTPRPEREEILESILHYREAFRALSDAFREESSKLRSRLGDAATPAVRQWVQEFERFSR